MTDLRDILHHLNSPRRSRNAEGEYYTALCPYHDDHARSLQVGPGFGFKCHGCGMSGNLNELLDYLGVFRPEHEYFGRRPVQNGKDNKRTSETGRIVARYTYCDQTGKPLYDVVRYVPKDFRIMRYCYYEGKLLGRTWGIGNVKRVLYRLPQIIQSTDETIIFVEGEKDANRLHQCGFVATTVAGGVGRWESVGISVDSRPLRGRKVVAIPDEDMAGRAGVECLRDRLRGVAGRFHELRLPGLEEKQDVSDWLNQKGNDKERLCKLLSSL